MMKNTPTENEVEVEENTFSKEILQCEIGEKLKRVRKEKGFTSEHIIQELKFNIHFLNALESGNWEDLPGEVYTIGFLKQYAALLKIDVSTDIERIKSKSFEMKTPVVYRDVPISPQKKWTFIAIAVFIILMVILNFSEPEHTEVLQIDNSINQENIDFDITNEQLLTDEFIDTYTNIQPEETTTPITEEDTKPNEEEVLIRKKTYSFYAATSDVWLQVSALDENLKPKVLREVLLRKGQRFSINDTTSKLMLTSGNARSLEILEGKKVLFAAGTLGEKNKVLKFFPINP